MSYPRNGWVNETPDQDLPPEEPDFAKHEWDDHHAQLDKRAKHACLRHTCPHLLRRVSSMRDLEKAPLEVIERASTAEEQYGLLKHFYVLKGLIPENHMKEGMNKEELVIAFNMKAAGKNIKEIGKKLNRAPSTVWRALKPKDEPKRTYHRLTKRTKECLIKMYKAGMSTAEIAEKTRIPHRTVRGTCHKR